MSNKAEQKKDEAGANSENGQSAEVSSTSSDSPVGVLEKPKYTEEAGSSTADDIPDSSNSGKTLDATREATRDVPRREERFQIISQSGQRMTDNGPGHYIDTIIIEISDDDSDTSTETSPESSPHPSPEPSSALNGTDNFPKNI